MKPFRIALLSPAVFVLLLLILRSTVIPADAGSPPLASISTEAEFRRSLGFRSDEAYIEAVRAAGNSVIVESLGGIVLTPAEFEELQIRLEIEKDVDTLLAFFESNPELQNAFGGIYIEHFAGAEDHTQGGKLVLQLVEGHVQSQSVLSRLPSLRHPDRLQIQWVTYSDNELEALFESIPRAAGPFELEAIFKDVKHNSIGVVIDLQRDLIVAPQPVEKTFLPQYWRQQLGHPAVIVYNGRAQFERTVVRGGDSWSNVRRQENCTIGFEARENATGRYVVVTAGHCATALESYEGERIYHETSLIGYMGYFQVGADSPFGVGIDAAFIRTLGSSTARDDIVHLGTARDISGETSDYTVGRNRCWTGQITGTRCGPITCQNLEFQDSVTGKWNNRVFTIDPIPASGDSGAPVYEVIAAPKINLLVTGILFAKSNPFAACMNGIDSLGSRWQDIRDFYGLTLVTR